MCYPDTDRFPTAPYSLVSLRQHIRIADRFKGILSTSARYVAHGSHRVTFGRIHGDIGSQTFGQCKLGRKRVHGDKRRGSHELSPHQGTQAHPAQPKDDDGLAWTHLGRVHDGTHTGQNGTAKEGRFVRGNRFLNGKTIPPDKAALFGCAILTGVGAVMNTAQVRPGEPVVIFGLGGVGLSALMGAKLVGASPLVAVDALPAKFALAKRLGADVTVNATEGDPVAAVRDVTGGGAEYAFEAVGNANVLAQAYKAIRRGGKTISIGIAHPKQQLAIQALSLVALEKTIQGSFMGSAVPLRDIPRLLNLYLAGKLPVDELLSPSITLDEINEGFDRLAQGTVVRQLIQFF